MRLIRRLLFLFQQRRHAAELSEEMEFHRQMLAESGDVHRMGPTLIAQEDARAIWLPIWIESVFQDLRYGWRSLAAHPGFTSLALMALVLGISLDTSLFSLFNSIALRPWSVRDPGSVVTIYAAPATARRRPSGLSIPEARYFREHSKTLAGVIASRHEEVCLDRQLEGAKNSAHFVSGDYFSLLGVDMALGRGFADGEDNIKLPKAVTVLSHHLWKARYASDPQIVGRTLDINDVRFTVVGVAGEDFHGTSPLPHDLWIPLASLPVVNPHDDKLKNVLTEPGFCCSEIAGRIAPGFSRKEVQSELATLAARYQQDIRDEPQTITLAGTEFIGTPQGQSKAVPLATLLGAAVGAILLLACANVSNLMLARAAARQREIAVRLSIGAGRARVIRQLLTESLLLAGIASAIGLLISSWLPAFVLSRLAGDIPWFSVKPDLRVVLFSIAISIIVAAAFGLAPALRATRLSLADSMKQQSTNVSQRFRMRGFLLGLQVAISVILLVSAGLMVRGIVSARSTNLGLKTANVALIGVDLPVSNYNSARGEAFMRDIAQQIAPLSPTGTVGLAQYAPLGNSHTATGILLPGEKEAQRKTVLTYYVNADFFRVLEIPVLAGRNFISSDRPRGAILINEAMARAYWPGRNPLGQSIDAGESREVVGIVRDAQIGALGPVEPAFFELFEGGQHAVFLLPAQDGPAAQAASIIHSAEPRAVINPVRMSQQLDRWLDSSRAGATIASVLGGLALLLATIGVYGVIAYSVEQRRREIGVRMALGASPRQIVHFVARSNSRALLIGLAAGIAGSGAASRLIHSQLFGVSRMDPWAYGSVIFTLALAGIAASIGPARRATKIAPLEALRYE